MYVAGQKCSLREHCIVSLYRLEKRFQREIWAPDNCSFNAAYKSVRCEIETQWTSQLWHFSSTIRRRYKHIPDVHRSHCQRTLIHLLSRLDNSQLTLNFIALHCNTDNRIIVIIIIIIITINDDRDNVHYRLFILRIYIYMYKTWTAVERRTNNKVR